MAPEEFLKNRIASAFAAHKLAPEAVEDLAFHMTDWKVELDQLFSLYSNIHSLSDSDIQRVIIAFLAHAPNHIAAAKKLIGFGPIEDVFDLGVLREDS